MRMHRTALVTALLLASSAPVIAQNNDAHGWLDNDHVQSRFGQELETR
ncbi:MAG TPA: hypothetical protein VFG49_03865 [Dyella sp.]|nr:hypothetical protein [Dyella sp.]HET6552652.1 hypothetical protein [Dyella sp.]